MQFFDRYKKQLVKERVPKERVLRWLYHTQIGRFFVETFIRKGCFSRLIGQWMNTSFSRQSILPFAQTYDICLEDFEKPIEDYVHFNDFFYRKFKPGKRVFNADGDIVCFSVDGRHLGFQTIEDTQKFFIKGENFNLTRLLGDEDLAKIFRGGTTVMSRLSPVDYHRFHFPVSGIPETPQCINGYYYSVHPLALKKNFSAFFQNKRWKTLLHSETIGKVMCIEIGATGVGSTVQTYHPHHFVHKGDEKGYFLFGGSTVITLFQPQKVQLENDLLASTQQGYELYAHCGDVLGRIIK